MAHHYPLQLNWTGNTLDGTYNRSATVTNPDKHALSVSSAPEYAGDATRWNPEDLLGSALSTCHMLTFLALAAKVRLEVKGYQGEAEAVMDTVDRISRVVSITLRPTIRVAPGTDTAKVVEMFEKAHKYCVIANSITAKVAMEPNVIAG